MTGYSEDGYQMAAALMTSPDPLLELIRSEYLGRGERFADRPRAQLRWVMNRPSYDRVRAACVTDEQERARADEHARVWIPADPVAGLPCPVCSAGPFDGAATFAAHMQVMADPERREPDPRDQMFGYPIEVRPDGGEPHLDECWPERVSP